MRTLRNINKDTEGIVQEFIGTAYDDVKFVADNMDTIQLVVDAINNLNPSAFATLAQGLLADSAIQPEDIDSFAKLSTILTDGTLIKSTDSRLTDTRDPNAHVHTESEISDLQAYLLAADVNTLAKINALIADATLGDAADYATAAQGAKADTALQANGAYHDGFSDFVADEHLPSSTFATAAQGATADTAVQPGDLGTAAVEDVGYFATAAQGALADTALQAGTYATAGQGALADSAVQPADLAGKLTYKGTYDATGNSPDLDVTPIPVLQGDVYKTSVTGSFYGTVTLEVGDILIATQDNPASYLDWIIINKNIDPADFADAAQGALADSALQPEDINTLAELNALLGSDLIDDTDPRLLPIEGTALKSTGVTAGFVATAVGDNTTIWAVPDTVEGTTIKSTGVPNGRVLAANGVVGAGNGCTFIEPFTYASLLTVKGDIETFDTARTKLGIGANGTVLTADSNLAKGMGWGVLPTPPVAGMTVIYVTTGTAIADKYDVYSDSGLSHTLPVSPTVGMTCVIRDFLGDASNNNIIIGRNGATINGGAVDVVMNEDGQICSFMCNATGNWIFSTVSDIAPDYAARVKIITAITYDILEADNGYRLLFDNASPIDVTLPDGLSLRHNFIATQIGAGVVTVTPDTDTVNGVGTGVSPDNQWGSLNFVQYASTTWLAEYTKAGSYLSLPG